ncbi:ferric reductase-like transmembrane domain-containing protein [Herbiconiux sp. A18JL235]|uniref:Ferric reductase-like transmembrane domain-containing protein n=1 Tax=Herbiconiux sp. A18JL235 TaxID=3152363 RepID=A0AB39BBM9_9MICO
MSEVLWAIGRISGVMSLLLFTASVLLGVLTRAGKPLPGLPRFGIVLVHRNVSLLASAFLVLHVLTLLGDSYAKLSLVDIVIPFLASYEPFWQGLGTVAFDLVVAVVITALLRHRLPARVFRLVHWIVYLLWPVALLHSLGNGTDGSSGWFVALAVVSAASVAAAVIWRVASARFRSAPLERAERTMQRMR